MLLEPKCFTRKCKHYIGVEWMGDEEESETNVCRAFPLGIPDEIAYGDNKHSKLMEGQEGKYIYEKGERT